MHRAPRTASTRPLCVLPLLLLSVGTLHADDYEVEDEVRRPAAQVRLAAEAGFFATLRNFAEFGTDASRIDFREAAGQDNLLYYSRWSVELDLAKRHTLIALYQPLASAGTFVPEGDVRYADVAFVGGEPIDTTFSFPYYRLSYLYRLVDGPRAELQAGLTGQLRNANYTYAQAGQRFGRSADVGFVPAFKLRGSYRFANRASLGFEADGVYAPISVFNGSTNDTVGAILDASVHAGYAVSPRTKVAFVVRYLGGGATNSDPNDYAKNWLHFLFFGVGLSYDLVEPPAIQ